MVQFLLVNHFYEIKYVHSSIYWFIFLPSYPFQNNKFPGQHCHVSLFMLCRCGPRQHSSHASLYSVSTPLFSVSLDYYSMSSAFSIAKIVVVFIHNTEACLWYLCFVDLSFSSAFSCILCSVTVYCVVHVDIPVISLTFVWFDLCFGIPFDKRQILYINSICNPPSNSFCQSDTAVDISHWNFRRSGDKTVIDWI